MKRFLILPILICTLLLASCNNSNIGIIGGADGPTSVFVGNPDNYEIEPVRMVNVKGELYFDIDEESDVEARCGVLDGEFTKKVGMFDVPKNDGESNFSEGKGYQLSSGGKTIEIPIGDDWEVFQKIDTNSDILKYTYCYTIEGILPNAKDDSEFLVLADTMDITFEEVYYKMFGSDSNMMKDIYVLPISD